MKRTVANKITSCLFQLLGVHAILRYILLVLKIRMSTAIAGVAKATATIACLSVTQACLAGTYSVIGIEWQPGHSSGLTSDGGFFTFVSNDVNYGFSSSVTAPLVTQGSFASNSKSPAASGLMRWKVRWVGDDANDPVPQDCAATIQTKGTASYFLYAVTGGFQDGGAYLGSINSLFIQMGPESVTAYSGNGYDDPSLSDDGDCDDTSAIEGAGFTHVSGFTYETYVSYGPSASGYISAYGYQVPNPPFPPAFQSSGNANADLDLMVRLTHINGVRVQSDL